jgi:hypothetical protein
MKKAIAVIFSMLPLSFIMLLGFFLQKEEGLEEDFVEDEEYIRIAVFEDKAYWVINNSLYEADFIDGEIDKENSKAVDAFNLDFKQVNKMMEVLDGIQDWKN